MSRLTDVVDRRHFTAKLDFPMSSRVGFAGLAGKSVLRVRFNIGCDFERRETDVSNVTRRVWRVIAHTGAVSDQVLRLRGAL